MQEPKIEVLQGTITYLDGLGIHTNEREKWQMEHQGPSYVFTASASFRIMANPAAHKVYVEI